MINIVVCDDDKEILNSVIGIVELKAKEKDINYNMQAVSDSRELIEKLKEGIVDVLFLDIDMPYYSGMDIASYINEHMLSTIVVFVTSHDALVYKTFAYRPFGFLRKTHISEEIDELMDRLACEITFRKQELIISRSGEYVKIHIKDIDYIESEGNYLNIHTGNECIKNRDTMTNIENELKNKGFIRCHKGYLVNLSRIEKIKPAELQVKSGKELIIIPVGRSYEKDVKKKIFESIKRG